MLKLYLAAYGSTGCAHVWAKDKRQARRVLDEYLHERGQSHVQSTLILVPTPKTPGIKSIYPDVDEL